MSAPPASWPFPVLDSHCHVTPRAYGDEVDTVLERARAAGVVGFIVIGPGYGEAGNLQAIDVAGRHPDCWATVGVHPHDAATVGDRDFEQIARWLTLDRVVAMGEIGLDFHYDRSPRDVQDAVFRRCIRMGREAGRPLVIHSRAADAETLSVLDAEQAWDVGVLIHCFSHDGAFAREVLARGGQLSIPGIVTFKGAAALQAAVREAPLDRLLVETDSPFLAPIPWRGQRNEPAFVGAVVEAVARLQGRDCREVAEQTTANACRFFGIQPTRWPAPPWSAAN